MFVHVAAVCLGAGLCALLGPAPGAPEDAPPPRPAVRVYTNEDLERVHPFRGETGVHSVPAEASKDAAPSGSPPRPPRGEDYWRREAARVRERVRRLEAQAAELRARITETEEEARAPGRRRRSAAVPASAATLRARLAALERRMRDAEDDLADRARREGALPGWLRD